MFELTHWTDEDLDRFLVVRQEFFLDPMGSNRDRFFEATTLLQRALFDWYLKPPGRFEGMLSLVTSHADAWSKLRKEERRTLLDRRFALNSARADTPAVESSVSANQWQRIFGSLGLGLSDPGTFDRFLVQLDEETNPSLRVNHRYLGELLPHDNMISYLSSITATFLNENAIIGKVSPCVTHMEEAAIHWLRTLVGWDGLLAVDEKATHVPLQRLPTAPTPNRHYQRWERDEPTGTIVAGGTIANISALLIARNAVFDYLLGWDGAVQTLGSIAAWEAVRVAWGYDRMVVLTSLGSHYSVKKSALQAGVGPANVIEIRGTTNPWILDSAALEHALKELENDSRARTLVIAVVPIAGKTETGYVDCLQDIAASLDAYAKEERDWTKASSLALPRYSTVLDRVRDRRAKIKGVIEAHLKESREAVRTFDLIVDDALRSESDAVEMRRREEAGVNEIEKARHNRLFIHVDAAHGGGYLTVPHLRHGAFAGIELADTITIDGHKSLYCYYPCGGLLIRTTRWARTLAAGHSDYISEETNHEAYAESVEFFARLRGKRKASEDHLLPHDLPVRQRDMYRLVGIQTLTGRSLAAERSELTHQPFNQYLEGSRGPQGIMQLYFNLATLGLRGYRSILEWTHLLSKRCEEAISLGLTDCRLVTDVPMPGNVRATDKLHAIAASNPSPAEVHCKHDERLIMPIAGGRFLRLSDGTCNQVLMTYVPGREAKLIASADEKYWTEKVGGVSRIRQTMAFLWRVNEHLWHEHIYANPSFTYYLGHTSLDLKLPGTKDQEGRADALAKLLEGWSAWLRPPGEKRNVFLQELAKEVAEYEEHKEEDADHDCGRTPPRFFCHKVIVMHPYTDESLLGDMLRRVAFWGERSVTDVRISDTIAETLGEIGKKQT